MSTEAATTYREPPELKLITPTPEAADRPPTFSQYRVQPEHCFFNAGHTVELRREGFARDTELRQMLSVVKEIFDERELGTVDVLEIPIGELVHRLDTLYEGVATGEEDEHHHATLLADPVAQRQTFEHVVTMLAAELNNVVLNQKRARSIYMALQAAERHESGVSSLANLSADTWENVVGNPSIQDSVLEAAQRVSVAMQRVPDAESMAMRRLRSTLAMVQEVQALEASGQLTAAHMDRLYRRHGLGISTAAQSGRRETVRTPTHRESFASASLTE
jgi:hypothetical protein